jgi:hypothetical protein
VSCIAPSWAIRRRPVKRGFVGPIYFDARELNSDGLVANAKLAGARPLWEFIGDGATVFSC